MKYRIVEDKSIFEFEKEVNRLLSCGWKLQGGVSVSTTEYSFGYDKKYCQAMVKDE